MSLPQQHQSKTIPPATHLITHDNHAYDSIQNSSSTQTTLLSEQAHINDVFTENIPKRVGLSDMDGIRYMIFGSLFILGVDSSLFPLDTVKTIIMSERSRQLHKQNVFRMIYRIAKDEGILRFWRGLFPSVIGSFPGQAMYYMAYESTQEVVDKVLANNSSHGAIFTKGFLSGACAEIAGGMFYVPADIVAQRLQIQSTRGFVHNSRLYSGPLDVVKKVLRNDGIQGFYRGYFAYVGAYAPASAVQWGSYELFKGILFRTTTFLETRFRINSKPIPAKENIVNGISGGLAAICAITANNPLEILRIRTQLLESRNKKDAESIRRGYVQLASSIFHEEGWRAFYRGLRVRMMVTIPSAIVAMSGYETIKNWSMDNI
ncbi:hypothetical protein BDV3_005141 [Batrachochytrium dendrobatidis]|uniref:Uncharacterized protein n=1 Tax=Batrachochytrium dendrobatidis (strain JEL423) TaxID=403673 RepID=A0A177WKQ7_BATDL|nr:hypothetical protein BDEG_24390 [Batrachochytrium dendrobatidis JEL423]